MAGFKLSRFILGVVAALGAYWLLQAWSHSPASSAGAAPFTVGVLLTAALYELQMITVGSGSIRARLAELDERFLKSYAQSLPIRLLSLTMVFAALLTFTAWATTRPVFPTVGKLSGGLCAAIVWECLFRRKQRTNEA